VSTGNLLQRSADSRLKAMLSRGSLATDQEVIKVISKELTVHENSRPTFCFDGFPRRLNQVHPFHDLIKSIIVLDLPESILESRITDRWVHTSSGRTYSYSYNPPLHKGLDDVTSEILIQRSDDIATTFKRRLQDYKDNIKAISDHYETLGSLIKIKGDSSLQLYSEMLNKLNWHVHRDKAACS
jgi:adenylate kinase family enzyme